MRPCGIVLILLALAAPIPLFLALAASRDAAAIFSQYVGAVAVVTTALTMLLATRAPWLENVFGGLDQIFVLHKWLGVGILAAALIHESIDAELRGLGAETALSELGEGLGEQALNGFIVIVAMALILAIPYRLWRWTHRLAGVVFLLAVAHFALVRKPFALTDPLGLYILGFCVLGAVSYALTLFPIRARRAYEVASVERTGGAVDIRLEPLGAPMRHQAGQFAFLAFDAPGLGEPSLGEPHPFTISDAPREDGSLRFTIKPLGDGTRRIAEALKPGVRAVLRGPNGRFLRPRRAEVEVWIAAGVGVTPFAAWSASLAQAPSSESWPIHIFYCARCRAEAPLLDEIERVAAENPRVTLHLVHSDAGERLTADQIVDALGPALPRADVAFCGPSAMGDALGGGLRAHGLPSRRFRREAFEIRGTIWPLSLINAAGIERLLGYLRAGAGSAQRYRS